MSDPFVTRILHRLPKPRKFGVKHKLMKKLATWRQKLVVKTHDQVERYLSSWDETNKEEADNYFRGQYDARVSEVKRQMLESLEAAKAALEANYQERCLKLEESYQQARAEAGRAPLGLEAELQEVLSNTQKECRALRYELEVSELTLADALREIEQLKEGISNNEQG